MPHKLKYQIFIDPYYGSERYVEFDPLWVVEVEDRYQKLFLRPKQAVTFLRFKNGEKHLVFGHHSAEIKAALAEQVTKQVTE